MEYERGRKDGVPSNVGPKPTFTGNAMQDALLDDGDKGQVRVYSVIFEPGARTFWHSHAAGPGGRHRACSTVRRARR